MAAELTKEVTMQQAILLLLIIKLYTISIIIACEICDIVK
ncbi:hypothetical protein LCGC14_0358900 [marine sediment metagenome]|uniref:Uncharacterized protein n=1 Tax=marine sediment metagenome TaxID=412755 RepID=A0A0F9T8R9_9ZZZZ